MTSDVCSCDCKAAPAIEVTDLGTAENASVVDLIKECEEASVDECSCNDEPSAEPAVIEPA